MNVCAQHRSLMSPMLDGELADEQAQQLLVHLKSCAACRQEWQDYQDLNERLAGNLYLPSTEPQCAAIEQAVASSALKLRPKSDTADSDKHSQLERYALTGLVAFAASLAMLFVLPGKKPIKKEEHSSAPLVVVGHLVRATGPIEVCGPASSQWQEFASADTQPLSPGTRLRTRPDVLCEVKTADSGLLRLGQSAEVVFKDSNRVQLIRGQVWCRAAENSSIDLNLPVEENSFSKLPVANLICPSATEIQCETGQAQISCQSTPSNLVTAQLNIGAFTCSVAPGEAVAIDATRNVERQRSEELGSKIWQLPLLAIDAQADGELMQLMRPILASLGMSKMRHLNEEQIRALGPLGAIPLLVYAQTERDANQVELRRRAVWLAGELADARSLAWLETLQQDPDPQVARLARESHERLSK